MAFAVLFNKLAVTVAIVVVVASVVVAIVVVVVAIVVVAVAGTAAVIDTAVAAGIAGVTVNRSISSGRGATVICNVVCVSFWPLV